MDATSTPVLPAPKRVRDLLRLLLDRDVTVDTGVPRPAGPFHDTVVAVYVDDLLRMQLVMVADLRFAAHAGAAIGLVPASGAHAAIKQRSLSTQLRENLDEVFNVMAALFNGGDLEPVRLHCCYAADVSPATDVTVLANSRGHRLDLRVTIAGYGVGDLAVVAA